MASASMFGSMSSLNPAVLGSRPSGQITLKGNKQLVEKNAIALETDGSTAFTNKQEISLTTASLFFGGKANKGDFITTEFTFDVRSGTKKDILTNSAEVIEDSVEVTSSYASFSAAIGQYVGLSYALFGYESVQNSQFSFGGDSIDFKATTKVEASLMKAGVRGSWGLINFSFFII